jgi:hypothetical protein
MCGADSEWALYGLVIVTWLLRSEEDGECGSWTAADVRFGGESVALCRQLPKHNLRWMRVPMIIDKVWVTHRWSLDRDMGRTEVANVWRSLEMVVAGKDVG